MGMDIYGIDPKVKSPRPELDFDGNHSDEVKQAYFEALREWESENSGSYFRASLWSWRPIQFLINYVNEKYNLGFDLENFGHNSGGGLTRQEDCDILADKLESMIGKLGLNEETDTLYLQLGMWVVSEGDHGSFKLSDEVQEELNEQYPLGTILESSVVASDGQLVQPAWSTSKSHIQEFVDFLRNCGGFEIW